MGSILVRENMAISHPTQKTRNHQEGAMTSGVTMGSGIRLLGSRSSFYLPANWHMTTSFLQGFSNWGCTESPGGLVKPWVAVPTPTRSLIPQVWVGQRIFLEEVLGDADAGGQGTPLWKLLLETLLVDKVELMTGSTLCKVLPTVPGIWYVFKKGLFLLHMRIWYLKLSSFQISSARKDHSIKGFRLEHPSNWIEEHMWLVSFSRPHAEINSRWTKRSDGTE